MPSEHTTQPCPEQYRPARPARRDRTLRRGLVAGCAALLTSAVIAGCGTAQGALQQPLPAQSGSTSPTSPSTGPVASIAPGTSRPSADAGTPGSHPSAPSTSGSPGPTSSVPGAARPGGVGPTGTTPSTPSTPAPPPTSTAPAPPPAPASGVSGSIVYSAATGGRTVALTFDDGPGPATGPVLDLLAQYGARATFCQIGPQAAANPAMVRRILAAGHRLCDHSVHHPQPFASLSHDRQVYEISAARDMIVQAGGPGTAVAWFRAPGGGFTASNQQVAAAFGMRPLGWTVDTRDWAKPGVPAIMAAVQRELRPGGVILMHDGGGDRSQSVAALRQLLPWLAAQGYSFDFPAV